MANSPRGGNSSIEMLPVAALLCDPEVRVRSLNRIARETFRVKEDEAMGRRPGEIVHCATASRQECGEGPVCASCILWRTVAAALAGKTVGHHEVVIPVVGEDGARRRVFLCSAAPVVPSNGAAAVLIVQDITDLQRLPGLIAICAHCKQVRHDGEWLTLDHYVETRSHALFTHTLCPACEAIYYRELGESPPPPTSGPAGEG